MEKRSNPPRFTFNSYSETPCRKSPHNDSRQLEWALLPVSCLWPSGYHGDDDADEGADDAQADGGVLMVQIRDRNENISVGISASPKLLLKN